MERPAFKMKVGGGGQFFIAHQTCVVIGLGMLRLTFAITLLRRLSWLVLPYCTSVHTFF